ncbi:MAG: valine--tRNA ligase [Treponema lecithinolyticum]|uniref:valine--tRNA ligase n=1 Tax=Treponema lecithinolyticum TaxID=53418 RepID=UPI00361633F4
MKGIELEKAYNPKDFEDRLYEKWEKEGCFKPLNSAEAKAKNAQPFTIVIPPPNVTGILHMGHALNNTLQDIIVRYQRMNGKNVLWLPGTDHAGIATQNVVERRLKKEGVRRQDLGRDAFVERTWQVKNEHHAIITKQLKKLGASVDWSRERFTMDEGLSKAVRHVFVSLYERGLIYRGHYLINWCPSCGTALADDEVEHEENQGAMYHLYYELESPLANGLSRIEIATTRPETLLGDSAVAVHPDDERYADIIGKRVKLPLTNRSIPVIADSYVDKEFGTGIVKITPAHDPNDWEVGKRHNLEVINILNPDGTLNDSCPQKYRGMNCKAARKAVIEDLKQAGLFKDEKPISHSVGHCYRCHTVVEPYVSDQWFVKMQPLAKKALAAWKNGDIVFYPKKWENTYAHWMENIRDWCISRQLWWGHRIPVWYCQNCGKTIVSETDPAVCPQCGAANEKLCQDNDVLDTWFSSWLWPFSTLGWSENESNGGTDDFKTFYPTSTLVTAYDIIFFWVSRMIMAALEFTGKVPFKDIYIHGLVRDKQGRKMSKSLGNGIDPLEIIDSYGSDALKFTLAFMCAQGQDVLVDKESFKMGSRFANKVWNASRYILGNFEGRSFVDVAQKDLNELDCWIYDRLNAAVKRTRAALEGYRYNEAAQTVYEYFWNDFCDWYVEGTKLSFRSENEAEKDRAVSVLIHVLEESLRLLHPFLPFVTEEIYSFLPIEQKDKSLIRAPYPVERAERQNKTVEQRFTVLQNLIRSVRALRIECGIAPELKISLALLVTANSHAEVCREKTDLIRLLAGVKNIDFVNEKPPLSVGTVGDGFEAFILVQDGIDKEQLKARFQKALDTEQGFIAKSDAKLGGKFAQNAPPEVVEAEKEKRNASVHRAEKLKQYIQSL